MTRIVAGAARGRRLTVPPGEGTRPTADRVREAVFSALEHRLGGWRGVVVLDLFAGTGALGIEALSRGAGTACFIDNDAAAVKAIRANLIARTRFVTRDLRAAHPALDQMLSSYPQAFWARVWCQNRAPPGQ